MDTIRYGASTPHRSIGALVRAWLRRESRPADPPDEDWGDTVPAVWSGLADEGDSAVRRGGEIVPASASEE